MKYEMPALTDEQREKEIRMCIDEIAHLKQMVAAGISGGRYSVTHYQSQLRRQQIALAALKLQPIHQERRFHVKGKIQVEYWAEVGKSEYQYIHESQRRIIYTSPPVPALKSIELPEPYDDGHGNLWLPKAAVTLAIRTAGYEVKE